MSLRFSARLIPAIALVLLASGCLDEEPPLACPQLSTTGGNPVGKWEILDVCMEAPLLKGESCADLREVIQGVAGTGSVEYGSETIRFDMTIAVMRQVTFSRSCLGTLPCDRAAEILLRDPAQAVTGAVCRGTDHCVCGVRQKVRMNHTDTYVIRGHEILESQDPTPYKFLVVGNELRIQQNTTQIRFTRL